MAEAGALEKINAATKSLSKGDSIREEMELVVGPNASWEDFLTPAPMCICLLGELMAISTTADFTLENNPPKDGFRLMKWPNSFRASLTQVVNSGWGAFNEAHKNMDQIRLMSSNVPNHLKDAIKILLQGENEELEDFLPVPLLAIQDTADRCMALASSVENKFEQVMDLIGEISEACVGAKGAYENELKDVASALAAAQENKKTAQEQKEIAKKAYEQLQKAVTRAEAKYDEAIDSIPGSWGLIAQNTVEGIAGGFTTAVSGICNIASLGLGSSGSQEKSLLQKIIPDKNTPGKVSLTINEDTIKAYESATLLKNYAATLTTASLEDEQLKSDIQRHTDSVRYAKSQFVSMRKDYGTKGSNAVQNRVIELCQQGIQICERIINHASSMSQSDQDARALAESLLSFNQSVMALQVEGQNIVSSCPTDMKLPNQSVLPPDQQQGKSASQQAVLNARFKIEQSQAQLDHTRERYDMSCDKLSESTAKLGSIMAEIQKLDIDKINFEKIRKTLIQGIKALGELREQWTKLVMFFQMMSNIIRCSLNSSLKDFGTYAKKTQDHALKNYPITNLKKDMIYQQAFEAAKIAHLVNMIAGTYVQVSKEYLMDKIAGLNKLQGYDPETESHAIRMERQKLNDGCQEAQEGIRNLVLEHKREFDMRVNSRIQTIKAELEKALPPPTASEKERIQAAVEKGMSAVKETEVQSTKGLDPDDFA